MGDYTTQFGSGNPNVQGKQAPWGSDGGTCADYAANTGACTDFWYANENGAGEACCVCKGGYPFQVWKAATTSAPTTPAPTTPAPTPAGSTTTPAPTPAEAIVTQSASFTPAIDFGTAIQEAFQRSIVQLLGSKDITIQTSDVTVEKVIKDELLQVETVVAEAASTVVKYSVKTVPAQSSKVATELDSAATTTSTGSATKSALCASFKSNGGSCTSTTVSVKAVVTDQSQSGAGANSVSCVAMMLSILC